SPPGRSGRPARPASAPAFAGSRPPDALSGIRPLGHLLPSAVRLMSTRPQEDRIAGTATDVDPLGVVHLDFLFVTHPRRPPPALGRSAPPHRHRPPSATQG